MKLISMFEIIIFLKILAGHLSSMARSSHFGLRLMFGPQSATCVCDLEMLLKISVLKLEIVVESTK